MSSHPTLQNIPSTRKPNLAVTPPMRKLLHVIFVLIAVLGANSIYLAGITLIGWGTGQSYENFFYLCMFGLHLVLGVLFLAPFLIFGVWHMLAARKRRNRRAVKIGYALFAMSIILLSSGILLVRIPGLIELKHHFTRSTAYWAHVLCPLLCIWLYWLHRLAGPRIKWKVGLGYLGVVGVVVGAMLVLQAQDPRGWNRPGSKEGKKYFEPSLVSTPKGEFIAERALMNDDYCLQCHQDAYQGWFHSAHHFSSFNNPAYLASIKETRKVVFERDGDVKASRWCAGCHDPVPFFTGAFDDPNYDFINDKTAHAGITCTVCHGITHIGDHALGNANYVIEEPIHYPFAYSDSQLLQAINNTLVKAKPEFHKKSMLKPFHKEAEFCAVCHKVHLPKELNHYKEFLRGQNHYDAYLLSGVSGHGARSFYYPPKAVANCSKCHMPTTASTDFAAQDFDQDGKLKIHSHLFPSANTAVAWWNESDETIAAHQDFLAGVMRVDLFGIKEGGTIDGALHAPLRPQVPTLQPGQSYLLETVIRTVTMGHLFTQGTVDSNEIWLDLKVTSGDRVIGRNGGLDEGRAVDPWSHFVNVFMLDREGNRISRRNAQDIFVPLYNNQIPPGAGQTVHYKLQLPVDLTAPVTITIQLKYRKFDKQYTDFIANTAQAGEKPVRGLTLGQSYANELPITVLAEDTLTFPVEGIDSVVENTAPAVDPWMRWNDYAIGLLLKGTGELRQTIDAFREVESLGRYDGPLNLARALLREGRNLEAVEALNRAAAHTDPPPPEWTLEWLRGEANLKQNRFEDAINNFQSVVNEVTPEMVERGFDFSYDYIILNKLGEAQFILATQAFALDAQAEGEVLLRQALTTFQRTLKVDSENFTAHYNLQRIYAQLGENEKSQEHQRLHARYKPDENARQARALARQKYPAADRAANAVVVYFLNRVDAPGLDLDAQTDDPTNQSSEQSTGE